MCEFRRESRLKLGSAPKLAASVGQMNVIATTSDYRNSIDNHSNAGPLVPAAATEVIMPICLCPYRQSITSAPALESERHEAGS